MTDVVRAAGGVVVRDSQVLLVHRPRYDDWSFPKGKAKNDESDEDCALREAEEETGLRCELGPELPSASYTDGRGRPKIVRYWRMRAAHGEPAPRAEVDEVRWLGAGEAAELLTWRRDLDLLRAATGSRYWEG